MVLLHRLTIYLSEVFVHQFLYLQLLYLNNYNFEAFIQKNDSNEKLKYRVRYGSFLSREDASMTANDIRNQLGYDCWVDKIEL